MCRFGDHPLLLGYLQQFVPDFSIVNGLANSISHLEELIGHHTPGKTGLVTAIAFPRLIESLWSFKPHILQQLIDLIILMVKRLATLFTQALQQALTDNAAQGRGKKIIGNTQILQANYCIDKATLPGGFLPWYPADWNCAGLLNQVILW